MPLFHVRFGFVIQNQDEIIKARLRIEVFPALHGAEDAPILNYPAIGIARGSPAA